MAGGHREGETYPAQRFSGVLTIPSGSQYVKCYFLALFKEPALPIHMDPPVVRER